MKKFTAKEIVEICMSYGTKNKKEYIEMYFELATLIEFLKKRKSEMEEVIPTILYDEDEVK